MFDFTHQKQETKKFLDILSERTACNIRITVLDHSDGTPKGYILNNKLPIKIEDTYYILERENAWHKNYVNTKSIIWSLSKEDQGYNVVLINDIKDTETFILRDFFLLWSSGNKFQAAFLLDRYVSAEEVVKIQKTLIQIYGCDKRALGATHNKNMPGFYNTQYPDYPYSQIQYIGGNTLDVNYIMNEYRKIYGKEEAMKTQQHLKLQQHSVSVEQLMMQMSNSHKKTWKDFYKEKQNGSKADMAYSIYLISRGYTDEQVKQALLRESQDIEIRKQGHLKDYLRRTLKVAREYYENYGSRRYK
jgi:hypothetical protein